MTTTTAQEITVTATELTRDEPFTHTVPGTASGYRYEFTVLRFGEEPVGLLVEGEPHEFCSRCGMGFGHYMWNSYDENDICFKCLGEGYGAETDEATLLRRAIRRQKDAERREAKRLAWVAERDRVLNEWKAANADLVAALEGFLPGFWEIEGSLEDALGPSQRKPASTFVEKMAVQVFDDLKPLTEKQAAAARDSIAKMQSRHEERVAAGHWGTVGKRAEVEVTVTAVRSFESDYGTRWLVSMKTAEGHVLKTWTSGAFVSTALDRKDDEKPVRIKATVKEHGEYRGMPETTVTRVAEVG